MGYPLFSEPYPKKTHVNTSHTPHSGARSSQTSYIAARTSLHPHKYRHFLPLVSLPHSACISAPVLSSLAANQSGGDIIVCTQCGGWTMNVNVRLKRKGDTQHRTDTPGILTGILCVPARTANLHSLPLTTPTALKAPCPLLTPTDHSQT